MKSSIVVNVSVAHQRVPADYTDILVAADFAYIDCLGWAIPSLDEEAPPHGLATRLRNSCPAQDRVQSTKLVLT